MQTRRSGVLTVVATIQGIFYVATGVWGIVDIESFEAVTGPKTDDWLVKTVSVVVAVSGAVFLMAAWRGGMSAEVAVLAIGDALGLAAIDIVYASSGRISRVYLLDAIVEVALAVGWIVGWWLSRRRSVAAETHVG